MPEETETYFAPQMKTKTEWEVEISKRGMLVASSHSKKPFTIKLLIDGVGTLDLTQEESANIKSAIQMIEREVEKWRN